MKIGIDVMGGDFAPEAPVGGAILARKELPPDVRLCLFGDEKIITGIIAEKGDNPANYEIFHAPEVIGMGEHPTKAFSQKPKSSIAVGFEMLKNKKIEAYASAGNTGAMLVGSVYSVGTIEGIIRPSIATVIPKESGGAGLILDAGINSDCKPDMLYQFGILGSHFAQYLLNIPEPKIGILNIGEEEEKGNLLAQATFKLMKGTKDFNFIGNVESRDLFKSKVDVIVCDGFTGNIVLKQIETMYRLFVKQGFHNEFIDRFNYENYGGTPLLGVNAPVIIGHGISNDKAIKNMIILAKKVQEIKLCEKINNAMIAYNRVKSAG